MSRQLNENDSVWLYDDDRENEDFTEEDLQDGLAELITGSCEYGSEINWENMQVRTFAQAGLMTRDKGLVITLPDGSEYQLTIVQSR